MPSIEEITAYFDRMPKNDKTELATLGIMAAFALIGFLLTLAFKNE